MKKNLCSLLLPVLAISLTGLMTSCSSDSEEESETFVELSTKEDETIEEVYLDLFESKEFTPNKKIEFEVTFDDSSLLKYENGYFVSNIKEGTTVAHFVNPTEKHDVKVQVVKSKTIPWFELNINNLLLYKGSHFNVDYILTYNSINVTDYIGEISVLNETETGSCEISIDKNNKKVVVSGLEAGNETFSLSTNFLGYTLSTKLNVSTSVNNNLSVCGSCLEYDQNGPIYNISMYEYEEINLPEEIIVTKGENVVNYNDLTISSLDENIFKIENNKIIPVSTGKTYLKIEYQSENILISVYIYKPVLKEVDFETIGENARFNLDLTPEFLDDSNYSVTNPIGVRKYLASEESSKTLVLPENDLLEKLIEINVNGITYQANDSLYSFDSVTREFTFSSKLFDERVYGTCRTTFVFETSEYTVKYSTDLYYITQIITTRQEIKDSLGMRYRDDIIKGVYELGADINFNGSEVTGSYIKLDSSINYAYGFKGILDGKNHKITKAKSNPYGLMIQIGSDAVIKNLNFENFIYYTVYSRNGSSIGQGGALLSRFASAVTYENIIVSLDLASTNDVTQSDVVNATTSIGLFGTEVLANSHVKNVTINATNFDFVRLFAKNSSSTTFENVEVYAKSLKYVYGTVETAPGVTLHN